MHQAAYDACPRNLGLHAGRGGKEHRRGLRLGSMWGNLGAATTPLLVPIVLEKWDRNGDWHEAFLLFSAGYLLAAIAAIRINANLIVSGRSFEDYVRSRILEPLGMIDTGFSIRPQAVDRTAVVYRKEDRSTVEFCRYDPKWQVTMTMPDGGLFSTTSDMAKFAGAFLNSGMLILSKRSADEMLSQQSAGYGLGWILDEPNQFSHWGSSGTLIWGDQETNTVGAIFIQIQDRKPVADIHRRFRQVVTRTMRVSRRKTNASPSRTSAEADGSDQAPTRGTADDKPGQKKHCE